MAEFVSSRNLNDKCNEFECIIKGLSNDGGLYTPTIFNKIDIKKLYNDCLKNSNISYKYLSASILNSFFDKFSFNEFDKYVNLSYDLFDCIDVTPTTNLGDNYLLELYHGPTCAFKDVALTILPYLMKESYKKVNINKIIYILCATSGDTGKAALEGFKNVENTYITVFYPKGAVSKIQQMQMVTTNGNNTNIVSVNGNFDNCQKIVKMCMNNKSELLNNTNVIFSSANSINIGRLIPQVVYYFKSYFDLVNNNTIKMDEEVNFIVPTGNFGDILAGYFAKKIGLPINKLVCATNKNDVLYDFFNTGIYNVDRNFYETISPSMDILISSNLERLLFIESDYNDQYIKTLMDDLNNNKKYKINDELFSNIQKTFLSYRCDDKNIIETIKNCYNEYNKVIDTHTACAVFATNNLKEKLDNKKNIILSTASPYKFAKNVFNSIFEKKFDDDYLYLEELHKISNVDIPNGLKNLNDLPILHKDNIDIGDGLEYVKNKILYLNSLEHINDNC